MPPAVVCKQIGLHSHSHSNVYVPLLSIQRAHGIKAQTLGAYVYM
jgi:hypothetical protein